MFYYLLFLIPFNIVFSIFVNQYSFSNEDDAIISNDIESNGIYEFEMNSQDTIWVRTGAGLSLINFDNLSNPLFKTINHSNLPQGGAPAFFINKNIMVISGAAATYDNNAYRPMGTGIAWSMNQGHNWNYINQPIDSVETLYLLSEWGGQDSIRFKSITTQIYNVSYDLEITDNHIYATSFAGGLRRFNYLDESPIWELIPLPMDNQQELLCGQIDIETYKYDPVDPDLDDPESGGSDNHKAFSIFIDRSFIDGEIIWVGTGDGINRGIIDPDNDCINWRHYNEDDGLGDRWVIGIRQQKIDDIDKRLWAITWDPSVNIPIPHNLSYTEDFGNTWNVVSFFKSIGAIVYDLYFDDDLVYASTDLGLYRTYNDNLNLWFRYDIQDSSNQTIMTDRIYASFVNTVHDSTILWAGSPDGLFYSYNEGSVWEMYRAWNRTSNSEDNNKRLSAYPNPFYIDEGYGYARIVYHDTSHSNNTQLDIFDFSMQHIQSLSSPEIIGDEAQFVWDGRDKFSQEVSNGVYLCRLTIGGATYWTKLMVVHS